MESRIEATHRLQREGRWGLASTYRDQVRESLRNEGVRRADASAEAWRAMILKYPPLTAADLEEIQFRELVAKSDDIPEGAIVDRPYEIAMAGAWWVTWMLRAALLAIETQNEQQEQDIAERICDKSPSRSVYYQAVSALQEPSEFISLVEYKCGALVGRLDGSVVDRQQLRQDLIELAESLTRLKKAIQDDSILERLRLLRQALKPSPVSQQGWSKEFNGTQ